MNSDDLGYRVFVYVCHGPGCRQDRVEATSVMSPADTKRATGQFACCPDCGRQLLLKRVEKLRPESELAKALDAACLQRYKARPAGGAVRS